MHHVHPVDFDDIGASPPDVRPHGVEEVGHIHNMGLLGHILQDGEAFGPHRRQHNVDGSPHGDHVEVDMDPPQLLRPGVNHPFVDVHRSAHGLKALNVLVDGAHPKVAAPRHKDAGLPAAAQQGADEVIAGPHVLRQVVGDGVAHQMGGVYLHRLLPHHPHLGPHLGEDAQQQGHVADIGDVVDDALAPRQHRGGDDGHRRVFGPADLHCAVEGISSSHYELIQWLMPLFCIDSVAHLERAPLSCFGKDRGKVHLYAVLSTV